MSLRDEFEQWLSQRADDVEHDQRPRAALMFAEAAASAFEALKQNPSDPGEVGGLSDDELMAAIANDTTTQQRGNDR